MAVVAAFIATLGVVERSLARSLQGSVVTPDSAQRLFPWILAAKGTLPRPIKSVRFEGAEARVLLERAPSDAEAECAPGQLAVRRRTPWGERPLFGHTTIVRSGELEVEWSPCIVSGAPVLTFDAAPFVRELARTQPSDAWVPRVPPRFAHGIVTPFASALGGAAWLITALAVSAALSATVFLKAMTATRGRGASRALVLVATLVVASGIALRVHAASRAPLDTDEVWALPTSHELLGATHDAWIHPPLYRVLQEGFNRVSRYREGEPLLHLRAPSLVFSSATLILLAIAIVRRRSVVGMAALTLLALSTTTIAADVLARPYALAALGVVATALAVWCTDGPIDARLAVLGFGVALWSDLVAGAAAACILASGAIERRPKRVATPAFVALVWALPLIPGIIAIAHGTEICAAVPMPLPAVTGNCLLPMDPARRVSPTYPAAPWLGPGSLFVVAAIASYARRHRLLVGVLALCALALFLETRIPLRTRNVLFAAGVAVVAWSSVRRRG